MVEIYFYWNKMKIKIYIFAALMLFSVTATAQRFDFTIPEPYAGDQIRFGDLNGDGQKDFIVIQNSQKQIGCIAAFELSGKLLWSKGTCVANSQRSGYDLPAQIHDLNKDGKAEVVTVMNRRLQVIDGITGKTIRSTRIPIKSMNKKDMDFNAWDTIFISNLYSKDHYSILIKNRYHNFWVYDARNLKMLHASDTFSTGHYPSVIKNSNGTENLLIGYRKYSYRLKNFIEFRPWPKEVQKYRYHIDSIDVKGNRIIYSTSKDTFITDTNLKVLDRYPLEHSQMSSFLNSDNCISFDKNAKKIITHKNNIVIDLSGEEKFSYVRLKNWNADGVDLVALNLNNEARILDENLNTLEVLHHGSIDARIQHFDIIGDQREEILLHSRQQLFIFSNPAPGKGTIRYQTQPHNFTFYSGDK